MCTFALRNYPTKLKHLHRNSIIEYPQELPYQLYHHHRSPRRRRAPLFNFINTLPFARTFFITYQYNQPNWRRDRWKDTIITIPSAHFWWPPSLCPNSRAEGSHRKKKTVPRSYHYPLLRASVSTRNSGSSHPPERSPLLCRIDPRGGRCYRTQPDQQKPPSRRHQPPSVVFFQHI